MSMPKTSLVSCTVKNVFLFAILCTMTLLAILGWDLTSATIFKSLAWTQKCQKCDCNKNITQKNHVESSEHPESRRNIPKRSMYAVEGLDLWLNSALLEKRYGIWWVHILGVQRKRVVKEGFLCKWNYTSGNIRMESKANHSITDASWPNWGPVQACRFTCQLQEDAIPKSIQLTSRDGKLQFPSMPVERGVFNHPREFVAVCVKPMTGNLSTMILVEWFETMRAVGLEHFIMYHTDVVGNGRHVLNYYEQLGVLKQIHHPFLYSVLQRVDPNSTLAKMDKYAVYQHVYLAAMQDCLYRYKNAFKYIIFMDIDEVLLPTKNESIRTMLKGIARAVPDISGYLFLTAWHYEEFGAKKGDKDIQDLYLQKYVESTGPTYTQPKCVVDTEKTDSINFHGVLTTVGKARTNVLIAPKMYGYIHHYRGRCDRKFTHKYCNETLLKKHWPDPPILRIRDVVVTNVRKVIDWIQLH